MKYRVKLEEMLHLCRTLQVGALAPNLKPSHIILFYSRYVFTKENLRQIIPTDCGDPVMTGLSSYLSQSHG